MKRSVGFMLLLLLLPVAIKAQSTDEREAVRQAVLDYVEGIYEVNPSRVECSVHADLAKRGFFKKKGETAYSEEKMTFQELMDTAAKWNKSGRLPKDAVKEVVVFDVADQTASAKVTAVWGIDYLHLAKYEGKWKIVNVVWQTAPPKTKP
jgi:competence protein ComGC